MPRKAEIFSKALFNYTNSFRRRSYLTIYVSLRMDINGNITSFHAMHWHEGKAVLSHFTRKPEQPKFLLGPVSVQNCVLYKLDLTLFNHTWRTYRDICEKQIISNFRY